MSKWKDDFCSKWENTTNLKRITREIKGALYRVRVQKQVDKDISGVLKGKFKRVGKRK